MSESNWHNTGSSAEEIARLREYLARENGIRGLEILEPDAIEAAVKLFYRDGFVVVANALDSAQLDYLHQGSQREVAEILALDPDRRGNRGSHRYSFGSASRTGHLMHLPEWTMLIDLPAVTPIVTAIFDSPNYIVRGGGGDFCLPGAVDYQPLHSDMGDRKSWGTFASFHDPRGILRYRDLPCPYLCCNFLTVDFTPINGPTRQIPGTQHSRQRMPALADEPEWMKLSSVCPAPAGSVLIRDVRAWHGGTPHVGEDVRAMPNVEFFAPWFREELQISMPRERFETLSEHGKRLCRYIVAEKDEVLTTEYREDLGGTPPILADPG